MLRAQGQAELRPHCLEKPYSASPTPSLAKEGGDHSLPELLEASRLSLHHHLALGSTIFPFEVGRGSGTVTSRAHVQPIPSPHSIHSCQPATQTLFETMKFSVQVCINPVENDHTFIGIL